MSQQAPPRAPVENPDKEPPVRDPPTRKGPVEDPRPERPPAEDPRPRPVPGEPPPKIDDPRPKEPPARFTVALPFARAPRRMCQFGSYGNCYTM
ncbi:MAG TPA: hypothetical protein VI072_27800 [Polyangiaceae bacterium]